MMRIGGEPSASNVEMQDISGLQYVLGCHIKRLNLRADVLHHSGHCPTRHSSAQRGCPAGVPLPVLDIPAGHQRQPAIHSQVWLCRFLLELPASARERPHHAASCTTCEAPASVVKARAHVTGKSGPAALLKHLNSCYRGSSWKLAMVTCVSVEPPLHLTLRSCERGWLPQ